MPAVANAVYDAVGVRVDEVPITPEKILKALEAKAQGEAGALRPGAFPEIAWPETLLVPPPGKAATAGRATTGKDKLRSGMRSAGTMMTREEALRQKEAADDHMMGAEGAERTDVQGAIVRARPERAPGSTGPRLAIGIPSVLAEDGSARLGALRLAAPAPPGARSGQLRGVGCALRTILPGGPRC